MRFEQRMTQPEFPNRYRIIAAATMTVSLVGLTITLVFPYLSLKLAAAGYSKLYIGIATGVSGVANIMIAPLIPRLAQIFGVRNVILFAIAVAIACLLLFDPFPHPVFDFILRFLTGAAIGTLFIMGEFWINAASPEKSRGLMLGIYGSFLAIGFASGPAILEMVGTQDATALYIGAAIFAVAAIPIAFMTQGAPSLEGGSGANVWTFMIGAPIATLAGLLFGMVEPSAFNLLPLYGLGTGLSLPDATALISAMALGNMLTIPIGFVADRVDRRYMLLFCGVIGATGALLLPLLSHSPAWIFAGVLIWSGSASGLYTVGLTLLGARYHGADLAHANASFIILYNVGMLSGPPLVGAVMDQFPPHGFFLSLAGMFALYTAIVAGRLALRRAT
jgi:MFS family permease